MGSTAPCGYCGHEPTTQIVFESIARRIARTSAILVTGSQGTFRTATPRNCPPLSNAGCAVVQHTRLGLVMPLVAAAHSRYVLMARMIDSVPPLVIAPHAPGGPWNMPAVMATTSASICRTPGNQRCLLCLSGQCHGSGKLRVPGNCVVEWPRWVAHSGCVPTGKWFFGRITCQDYFFFCGYIDRRPA